MPFVKNAATTLSQGVSQQAETQRFPSQATEQINAYSSPVKGLLKRPPAKFVNKISVDSSKSFVHTINRDSSEQYVVVVNPYESAVVTDFVHGSDTITIASELIVDDRIRFAPATDNAVLPTGLQEGRDYYVKSSSANGSNWDITVSRTKGGSLQKIGKATIDSITLQSVRHTDNQWVDGVFAVKFDTDHGLVEGDTVAVHGLTGAIGDLLDASEGYELRVPTKNFDYYDAVKTNDICDGGATSLTIYALEFPLLSGAVLTFPLSGATFTLDADAAVNATTLSGVASGTSGITAIGDGQTGYSPTPWPADTFLLGKASGNKDSIADKLGYVVDETWKSIHNMGSGTMMMGSGDIHWTPLLGTSLTAKSNTYSKTLIYDWNDTGNETFPTDSNSHQWTPSDLVGSLVAFNGVRNKSTGIRAIVTAADNNARTITLDRYVNFEDQYFDSVDYIEEGMTGTVGDAVAYNTTTNPKWVFLTFWADTSTANYAPNNNPRVMSDSWVSAAFCGSNEGSGSHQVEKGGIHVYDSKTGEDYPIDISEGFDYINDGNNPQANLKAVTVADYTFLVNTAKVIAAKKEVKYDKKYEAFITCKTADYGKAYKLKVGDKATPLDAVKSPYGSNIPVTTTASVINTATTLPVESLDIALVNGAVIDFGDGNKFTLNQAAAIGATTLNGAMSGSAADGVVGTTLNTSISDNAYVDIPGSDKNRKDGKWAFRIQAKTNDPKWNGWQFRFVQNWKWDRDNYPLAPNYNNNFFKHEDLKPNTTLSLGGITAPGQYYYFNEKIAVHMPEWETDGGKQIIVYVNFNWTSLPTTTVQDVIDAFDSIAALKDWEIKMLTGTDYKTSPSPDASGNTKEPEYTTPVLASDNSDAGDFTFSHQILGKRGELIKGEYSTREVWGVEKYEFWMGRDESVASVHAVGSGQGTVTGYRAAGYLSPTSLNVDRSYFSSKGSRVEGGWQWETSNILNSRVVETGEYWYTTPRWTGADTQMAIGTERIAEMLASDAKISGGFWGSDSVHKANGRLVTGKPMGFADTSASTFTESEAGKGKESALGLTYRPTGEGYLWDVNSAKILGKDFEGHDHKSSWQVQQQGYTVALMSPDRDLFNISVEDDLGGNGLKLTFFEVDEEASLPEICRHGHVVKVVGNAREEADDYYLRFEADDPNNFSMLQHGRWVECVGYEQAYKFDNSTMPLALVRDYNDDGATVFRLEYIKWAERAAGDQQSNPFPSFVGHTVNDIFLFRNRLGFLSGENVILSEAGEYFNFFRTTVAALLDTAPIDITASTNKVSLLRSAVPYNEKLILFSDLTQFILDAEPYLSPKTVTLVPANEIESIPDAEPVATGGSLYFASQKAGYSGMGELIPSRDDADHMEAHDATAHIPKYIKGSIKRIAAATNEDVICCITGETDKAILYVYKFFRNMEGQRVQSAWFKYQFGDDGDYIHDISFLANTLYIVLKRGADHYVEKLRFEDAVKDLKADGDAMEYEVLLDHRHDKPASTVYANNVTTITLHANYKVTSTMKLVTEDGVQYSSSTTGGNIFTVGVDLTSVNFFIGEPYTLAYTFSQTFLKTEKTIEGGRMQLLGARLEYANSRTFDVDITHNPTKVAPNKTTDTHTFATDLGAIIGTADLQDGFYHFPIMERNDRTEITLKNSSPYPSDFLSIDYEARAFQYGTRWRG